MLLVDLDPQGCLTFSLGQDPDKLPVSVHEVLLGEVEPNAALVTTMEGMTLLPANIDLAGAEAMLLMRAGREYALKRALAKARRPVRRGHHRLPAVAGCAHPQRADGRRRGHRAAAVRDTGTPRRRPVPAHRRRCPADHQPESAAAGRVADAVRLPHHPHPRRAARRRRPLRPAGARPADPAHGALRRGQRFGLVGDGRAQEQGRGGLPELAQALLKHWKTGKPLPTFAVEI